MIKRITSVVLYWVAVAGLQVVGFEIAMHGWSLGLAGVVAFVASFFAAAFRLRIRLATQPVIFAMAPLVFGALLVWAVSAADHASLHQHRLLFLACFRSIVVGGILALFFDVFFTLKKKKPNQPSEPTAMAVTPPAAQEPRQP